MSTAGSAKSARYHGQALSPTADGGTTEAFKGSKFVSDTGTATAKDQ